MLLLFTKSAQLTVKKKQQNNNKKQITSIKTYINFNEKL